MNSAMPPLDASELVWLLHRVPAGVLMHDEAGTIAWINQTLETLLGISGQDVVGRTIHDLPLDPSDIQVSQGAVYRLSGRTGAEVEWLARETLSVDQTGTRFVSLYVDVTDGQRARLKVDRMRQALVGQVSTDESTGLLSRHAVMHQLEAQVSRSRRYENPLATVMIRLHFRGAAGEQRSEQGMVAFSRMLRDQTRWPDIIGRWDEHDFLLVLPETPADATTAFQGKILRQLDAFPPISGDRGVACTAEFGIAAWRKGDDAQGLVERAMDRLAVAAQSSRTS